MEGGHDPDCRRCMPWEEIEKGVYEKELMAMKTLIQMRKKEEATHSLAIQFLYRDEEAKKERVIHYKKDQNFYVLLNATNEPIGLKEYMKESNNIERLFQWNCKGDVLGVNGTLIYKKNP
ncbi:MAG: alpha-glycosidase, partial [Clostridiales bacterium]|nr:alpha-glycosidase [Clostridiales bacterium]